MMINAAKTQLLCVNDNNNANMYSYKDVDEEENREQHQQQQIDSLFLENGNQLKKPTLTKEQSRDISV